MHFFFSSACASIPAVFGRLERIEREVAEADAAEDEAALLAAAVSVFGRSDCRQTQGLAVADCKFLKTTTTTTTTEHVVLSI